MTLLDQAFGQINQSTFIFW